MKDRLADPALGDRRGPGSREADAAGRAGRQRAGFTLVELLAVTLIIVLLIGLVVGLASYSQTKAGIGRAKAELAVLAAACEGFRSDQGRYPTSTIYRLSVTLYWEGQNSALLYSQLAGNGYLGVGTVTTKSTKFVPCETPTNMVDAIMDPWSTPYNYYCPSPSIPTSAWVNVTCNMLYEPDGSGTGDGEYLIGGQKRTMSFDLFSYGPDKRTTQPGGSVWHTLWPVITRVSGLDDDDIWY